MKFSVNRASSLKYVADFVLFFCFFFHSLQATQCYTEYSITQGIFDYTGVWHCIRSIWARRYYIHPSMKLNMNFLSRMLCISLSTKFWGHEIFRWIAMLFIDRWLMRHRYAFQKLSIGIGQQSLKWLKYVHLNRAFRYVSRACSFHMQV